MNTKVALVGENARLEADELPRTQVGGTENIADCCKRSCVDAGTGLGEVNSTSGMRNPCAVINDGHADYAILIIQRAAPAAVVADGTAKQFSLCIFQFSFCRIANVLASRNK